MVPIPCNHYRRRVTAVTTSMKPTTFLCGFLGIAFSALAQAQYQQFESLAFPPGTQLFYVDKTWGDNGNEGSALDPWRDLSVAYAQLPAAMEALGVDGPAALIVAPGYYAPSTGETFPIAMEPNFFICGTDAHTTILALEEGTLNTSVFEFGASLAAGRVFSRDDGPYLQRLTIRNTGSIDPKTELPDFSQPNLVGWGIRLGAPQGDNCVPARPVLNQLIIYGFNIAVGGEYVGPEIIDSTILANNLGLWAADNQGLANPCCGGFWDVSNSLVNGNFQGDLTNIDGANVTFTSFDVAVNNNCIGPGSTVPIPAPTQGLGTTNPDYQPGPDYPLVEAGFVNPPVVLPAPVPLAPEEFDLRLMANSPLRQITFPWNFGIASPNLWDGEGFMNLRMELLAGAVTCIGADQFNTARSGPLMRSIVAGTSTFPITLDVTRVGVFTGSPISQVELRVTPLGTSTSPVWALTTLETPVLNPLDPSGTSYIAPWLTNPYAPALPGYVFQGIVGLGNPVLYQTDVLASSAPEQLVTVNVTQLNFPLTLQVGFLEFLPNGDIGITWSNGQSHRTP